MLPEEMALSTTLKFLAFHMLKPTQNRREKAGTPPGSTQSRRTEMVEFRV